MSQVTERSPLLADTSKPQYIFDTNLRGNKSFRSKLTHSCLLFGAVITSLVLLTSLIAVSISVQKYAKNNSTNETGVNTFLLLPTTHFPLPGYVKKKEICANDTAWNNALSEGKKALQLRAEIEKTVTPLLPNSPSYKHQKTVATTKKARELANLGYLQENARKEFSNNFQEICYHNNETDLNFCNTDKSCNLFTKFRTYDGSCNNLKRPQEFGVAYQAFRRVLPPDYSDGINKPRVAKNKQPLPSARTVSLEVHRPYYKNDNKFSVVLAVWGQFLDHDMTATALSQNKDGRSISCCFDNTTVHPECYPVNLDSFDPYNRYNISCIEFVRSAPAPTCCLGWREQLNQVSSFIDGSAIYGVDEELVKKLRTNHEGKLLMYVTEDNRTLLPPSDDLEDGCNRETEIRNGRYCFMSGDARANENLHLTTMHLLWARQHNRVVEKLAKLNLHWDDERLFQETRKIVGAQLQHITYTEFLPILLGSELMEKYDLCPQASGYFTKYDDGIDPSIANNFATAAFRFAHSIIPGLMKYLAKDSSSTEFVQLHKMLFDPFKLYQPGELDRAIKSSLDTTIEANDPYFTEELQQNLFKDDSDKKANLCGLDLVSLNIQRGRDHGLVGYNSWRELCGLRRVNTFDQLKGDIDDDSLHNMQSVYREVDDVDLYTGALSEKPINGSILGPTLTCLILDQFVRVKYGDRFWYENPNWFTLEQLNEIRKSSLSRIICDNSDNVSEVQPLVMERDSPITSCTEILEPSWNYWEEKKSFLRVPFTVEKMSVKSVPKKN